MIPDSHHAMTHDVQIARFLAILSAHHGMTRAIPVAVMAGLLGFERDKAGQRRAQLVKAAVVERGHLVGSSCGRISGWYTPANDAEIQATLAQYKSRIRSLARLIRQTEGAAGFHQFVGELALEFTQEEVSQDQPGLALAGPQPGVMAGAN